MDSRPVPFVVVALAASIVANVSCAQPAAELEANLKLITLPPGFQIDLYASGVENARQMAIGANGTLFVGSRQAGVVSAVVDTNGDHRGDKVYTIWPAGKNLPDGTPMVMPSGVAFRNGALYVAAVSHVLRFDDIESRLENPGEPVIVTSKLPDKKHHGWKFIDFGPDGKLYFSVGAWCNICENETNHELFATIARMNPDGTGIEVVARGVRNTVGFDFHPETGELWFAENGGDDLGDDIPADELNRISQSGQHFGYPYIHQGDLPDPRYGAGHSPADYTPPAMNLGPHVAAIGMRFYTGDMFPARYRNQIFIAEHGSWNRRQKIGYRITIVSVPNGIEATAYEDFAIGWLQGQRAWGRPADVLVTPDGALLISDDQADAIYRVTYTGPK